MAFSVAYSNLLVGFSNLLIRYPDQAIEGAGDERPRRIRTWSALLGGHLARRARCPLLRRALRVGRRRRYRVLDGPPPRARRRRVRLARSRGRRPSVDDLRLGRRR